MSEDRYSLYRLCECPNCGGTGREQLSSPVRVSRDGTMRKCSECRGEGRIRQSVVDANTAGEVGQALITCGWEGEWKDENGNPCAFGFLDRDPDCHTCAGDGCDDCHGTGKKGSGEWYCLPWLPSARNVRDAARTLARSKKTTREP